MKLVIVESPTKSRTISKFLGPQYRVFSSYGHVRDLPKNEFGIEVENDFKPKYIIIPKARNIIRILKKEVEKADLTILSLDPDREGEAIAWHLVYLLGLNGKKPYQRIVFHEITESAIKEALKNPRRIDLNLVNAQQTRRILDRIVGYKLSPFLWKKVARRLSAGRVQSVALRLVVEREREIENFLPQEYWKIEALLQKIQNQKFEILNKSKIKPSKSLKGQRKNWSLNSKFQNEFKALLIKKDSKTIPKLGIKTKKEADKIIQDLKGAEYKVINIEKKEIKRNPLPPFITSTLQQEAWRKFKLPAKMTMKISQQLYEKGWITYYRSDSFNISNLALGIAKKFITKTFGNDYYQFRKYKTKSKVAQEAHEAIRPTYPDRTPEKLKIQAKLDERQFQLYDLIWRRFIASQMTQALFDSTKVDIQAKNYIFRATGQILKFDGFLKVYPIKYEETELPPLEKEEILELIKLISTQHFTQPPPRYTEATLIKELEENGIGRPSTYALILATIQERNYVRKDENKRFYPTEIGFKVNDLLVRNFPKIVDINFTAKMENDLDKIAQAKENWIKILREFYIPFNENLNRKYKEISKEAFSQEETSEICPNCSNPLVIKLSKYGRFYSCSTFPKCKYKKDIPQTLGIKCPNCQTGEIIEKRTKNKKFFYGCSNYPECHFALWEKPIDKFCSECGAILVKNKWGKIKCSNQKCSSK